MLLNWKKIFPFLLIIFASMFFYVFTLRGAYGNFSTIDQLSTIRDRVGPFESSHEMSSYATTLSLIQNKTISFGKPLADFSGSDVGFFKGKFYSFFPPGVAVAVIPLYLLGSNFNLALVFAYGTVVLITIINLIYLFKICREVFNFPVWVSVFCVFIFGFGSTAWSYSITIYQHQFVVFFLLVSFYATWRYRKADHIRWVWATLIWILYGISIYFDYPNVIILSPIIVYFFLSSISLEKDKTEVRFKMNKVFPLTLLIFFGIILSFLYYNYTVFGNWKTLHNTLPAYIWTNTEKIKVENQEGVIQKSSLIQGFKEKSIITNSEILLISKNRGILFFTPIFILACFSIVGIKRRLNLETIILLCVLGVTFLLYCSWGDPWGGEAYGSRYLIPIMPILSIFVADFLYQTRFKVATFILFVYSSAVALLGALTTNMVIQGYKEITRNKKADFFYNLDFLKDGKSGSFIYNNFFIDDISLVHYFFVIYGLLLVTVIFVLFILPRYGDNGDSPQ